jgi:curved DNA-binding protein CbpA
MSTEGPTHYQVLGVSRRATAGELRAAWRKLARQYHPDRCEGGPESQARMAAINLAYQVLGDADRRAAYDRSLDGTRRPRVSNVVPLDPLPKPGQMKASLKWLFGGSALLAVSAIGWAMVTVLTPSPQARMATIDPPQEPLALVATQSLRPWRGASPASAARKGHPDEPQLRLVSTQRMGAAAAPQP